jgi:hypothetical protein
LASSQGLKLSSSSTRLRLGSLKAGESTLTRELPLSKLPKESSILGS